MATQAAVQGTDALITLVHHAWADVLGHEEFTDDDHFFQIGGHSLDAVEIMRRLGDTLGRRLPVRLLLRHPTVRSLAAVLAAPDPGTSTAVREAGA
ncbi:phosphopantetheine-binding protein [Streptomyces griseoluteus]|uniref:phosphopantetheine-binding protein n=1 Tax=Streptomyces griseoluteus TaxID=29306 RepID=UPI0036849A26